VAFPYPDDGCGCGYIPESREKKKALAARLDRTDSPNRASLLHFALILHEK